MAASVSFRRRSFVLALGSTVAIGACSPGAGNGTGQNISNNQAGGSSGAGAQTSGTGSANASGNGGATTSDPSAGGAITIGSGPMRVDPSDSPDASCAAASATAEQRVVTKTVTTQSPVALYLVQDRSGSMKDTPRNATQDKWTQATDAMNAFVADPASAGLDVALAFFPIPSGVCDGTNYNVPKVPMARLPSAAQVTAVSAAITANAPGNGGGGQGGTPIEGALRGGENYCMVYQAQNPAEKCVVVLITDGAPNGCNQDFATLAGIAGSAKMQANVLTFAVGMDGADFGLLDQIATAGGSTCGSTPSCNVASGTMSLSQALNAIRTTVTQTQMVVQSTKLACEYTIPTPSNGQNLDPNKVNVQITKGGVANKVGQVPDMASCASFGNAGWYYDDPKAPKTVKFCPSTCSSLDVPDAGVPVGTEAPHVDLLFGCPSHISIPA